METTTADWIIRVIVVAVVGYFFWKFKKIDQFATREELKTVKDEIQEDCDACEAHNIAPLLESHREEQRIDTQAIHTHIREVRSDLGREIGVIKDRHDTLDKRIYNLATKTAEPLKESA